MFAVIAADSDNLSTVAAGHIAMTDGITSTKSVLSNGKAFIDDFCFLFSR
jgi:hypothetical protein